MLTYRHGDWTFTPTFTDDIRDPLPQTEKFVFGEGEATGHYHVALAARPDDMLWERRGDEFIAKVLEPIALQHPEHSLKGDLVIPPGTYRVYRRREKDWFSLSTRRVID